MCKPKTVDDALNGIKWFQYVHQSGRSETENNQVPGYEYTGIYNVSTWERLRGLRLLPS